MNEENFSAPEEQKEKRMKKFLWTLAAIALIVVVGVACTQLPTTKDPSGEQPVVDMPVVDLGWQGGVLKAHGMALEWEYTDNEDYANLTNPLFFSRYDRGTNECGVVFHQNSLRRASANDVGAAVGLCMYILALETPPNEPWRHDYSDPEAPKAFSSVYGDAYVAHCGEIYEPLAWGNASDGKCELPDPVEVARSFYGWDEAGG